MFGFYSKFVKMTFVFKLFLYGYLFLTQRGVQKKQEGKSKMPGVGVEKRRQSNAETENGGREEESNQKASRQRGRKSRTNLRRRAKLNGQLVFDRFSRQTP